LAEEIRQTFEDSRMVISKEHCRFGFCHRGLIHFLWAQTESQGGYDSIQSLSHAFVYSEEEQLSKETAA
jgi:hypothetical protein